MKNEVICRSTVGSFPAFCSLLCGTQFDLESKSSCSFIAYCGISTEGDWDRESALRCQESETTSQILGSGQQIEQKVDWDIHVSKANI
jgi:hypothetical protein